ncbi:MAG: hypothetical protein ACSHXZ_00200 [Gammaproteobacteria bacterium]
MRELSAVEVDEVSGGMFLDAAPYFTATLGIGAATFGSAWGALPVGLAFAVAPLAVGVMAGLTLAGGVALMRK